MVRSELRMTIGALALVVGYSAGIALGGGAVSSAPASDDIMQPTQHGLRATPEMMNGLARMFIRQAGPTRDLALTDEQQSRMADSLGRRLMESVHAHGQQWRDLLETTMEAEIMHNGRYDEQTGPQFAGLYGSLIPEMRDVTHDVLRDWQTVLDPQQARLLQEDATDFDRFFDAMQDRTDKWRKGEIDAKGHMFRDIPFRQDNLSPEQRKQREQFKTRLMAEQRALQAVTFWTPERLKPFMDNTATFFGFSEQQKAEAEKTWARVAAQFEQIMTPEWKQKVQHNRVRLHLADGLRVKQTKPWYYRLEREYQELIRPLIGLEAAFRDEIVALATEPQRRDAYKRLETAAREHGVTQDELRGIEGIMMKAASVGGESAAVSGSASQ